MPVENFGGSSGLWSCERCQKTFPDCNYVYNFTMRLCDYSETLYVGVLGEYPGEEIMGMTARELKDLCENDPNYQAGMQEFKSDSLNSYIDSR